MKDDAMMLLARAAYCSIFDTKYDMNGFSKEEILAGAIDEQPVIKSAYAAIKRIYEIKSPR